MELKDFVSNTIIQLIEGANLAQNTISKYDACINPLLTKNGEPHHPLYFGSGGFGAIQKSTFLLEFDISIQIENNTNDKSGFGVFVASFGAGVQSGSASSNINQNRIKFIVPYALPYSPNRKDSQ